MTKNSPQNTVKLFQNQQIRAVWDEDNEKWWFSVVDIVAALTDSADPKQYIKKMRTRDPELNSKWGTICTPLAMIARDGKNRKTQAMDTEGIFRLIQSIPSKKAEPLKQWLAQVGREVIDEAQDPEKAIDRAIANYRRLGYSESWINQRIKSIEVRKALTDEWDRSGVKRGTEYAKLTDLMYETWAGFTAKEYKQHKGLKKENLRDNMTNTELVLNMLAEVTATDISEEENPVGYNESAGVAKRGAGAAKVAADYIEQQTGKTPISSKNAKTDPRRLKG